MRYQVTIRTQIPAFARKPIALYPTNIMNPAIILASAVLPPVKPASTPQLSAPLAPSPYICHFKPFYSTAAASLAVPVAISLTDSVLPADCATLAAPAAPISTIALPASLIYLYLASIRHKIHSVWLNVQSDFGLTQPSASAAPLTARPATAHQNINASLATRTFTSTTTNVSTYVAP